MKCFQKHAHQQPSSGLVSVGLVEAVYVGVGVSVCVRVLSLV